MDISAYRRYIESALVYTPGTHTYDDVVAMVAAGKAQFWPGPASVIITEIVDYPQKRVLNIFLAAGTLSELEAMSSALQDWAVTQGCQAVFLTGRRGWERTFLARTGWEPKLVMFVKEL